MPFDSAPSPSWIPASADFFANLGAALGSDEWQKGQVARGELLAQSAAMADRMESWGFELRRSVEMTRVNLATGEARPCIDLAWANRALLPISASRQRRRFVKHLEWLESTLTERHRLRYWVVKLGWIAVDLDELREATSAGHRWISHLNAWLKETTAGAVELVFRSTEATFGDHLDGQPVSYYRTADGRYAANLHANLVVLTHRHLGGDRWRDLMEKVRQMSPCGYVHDAGELKDAAEVAKYVAKPVELLGLPDRELATVLLAWDRLNLVQPLGVLRDRMAVLADERLKLVKVQTLRGNKAVWEWRTRRSTAAGARQVQNSSEADGDVVVDFRVSPCEREHFDPVLTVRNFEGDVLRLVLRRHLYGLVEALVDRYAEAAMPLPPYLGHLHINCRAKAQKERWAQAERAPP